MMRMQVGSSPLGWFLEEVTFEKPIGRSCADMITGLKGHTTIFRMT